MISLLLSNALLACPLAFVAWLVGRRSASPALAHALWLLVLLKLVSPPLIELPLAGLEPPGTPAATAPASLAPATAEAEDPLDAALAPLTGDLRRLARSALRDAEADLLASEAEAPAAAASPGPPASASASEEEGGAPLGARLLVAALAPWAVGSLAVVGLALVRIRRFRALLRRGSPASRDLRRRLRRLAQRIGLARAPRAVIVDAQVSPMLWGVGSGTHLVLPRALESLLGRRELETLLLHELAHLKRRDHWVRFIELAAVAIYWWNPVLWLCRRELRRHEEECCDAWVVSTLPEEGRTYARALVTCIDFVAGVPRPVAPAATAMGAAGLMKRRVEMILAPGARAGLDARGRLALILIALVAIPVLPVFGQEDDPRADRGLSQLSPEYEAARARREREGPRPTRDELEAVIHTLEEVIDEVVAGGKSPRALRITRRLRAAIRRLEAQRGRAGERREAADAPFDRRPSRAPRDRERPADRDEVLRDLERMRDEVQREAAMRERELALHAREIASRVDDLRRMKDELMGRREWLERERAMMKAELMQRMEEIESRFRALRPDAAAPEGRSRSRRDERPRDEKERRERDVERRSPHSKLRARHAAADALAADLSARLRSLEAKGESADVAEARRLRAQLEEVEEHRRQLEAEAAARKSARVDQKEETPQDVTIRRSHLDRIALIEARLAELGARRKVVEDPDLDRRIAALERELARLRRATRGGRRRTLILDDRGAVSEDEDVIEEIEEEVDEKIIEEVEIPQEGAAEGEAKKAPVKTEPAPKGAPTAAPRRAR